MKKKAIVVCLIGGMLISLLATAPVLASDLVGQRPEKTIPATGVEKFVPPAEAVSLKDLLPEYGKKEKEEKGKEISLAMAKKIIDLVGYDYGIMAGSGSIDGPFEWTDCWVYLKKGDLVIHYEKGADTAFIYREPKDAKK